MMPVRAFKKNRDRVTIYWNKCYLREQIAADFERKPLLRFPHL
jgi:hypothetical protein